MRIKSRRAYQYKNSQGQTVWVMTDKGSDGKSEVYFPKTGYKGRVSFTLHGNTASTKDYYHPVVCGVGYLGDKFKQIKKDDKELCDELRCRWKSMLTRCYVDSVDRHERYIDIGVTVSDDWKNFSIFYYEVQKLPGFDRKRVLMQRELSLDKDKFAIPGKPKIYSKETCCWLDFKEQQQYTRDHFEAQKKSKMIVTYPDGHEEEVEGLVRFCKQHNLDTKSVCCMLNGKLACKTSKSPPSSVKGFKFRKSEE